MGEVGVDIATAIGVEMVCVGESESKRLRARNVPYQCFIWGLANFFFGKPPPPLLPINGVGGIKHYICMATP